MANPEHGCMTKTLLLLSMVSLIGLSSASCGAGGASLPDGATTAVDTWVKLYRGEQFGYRILSAERAATLEGNKDVQNAGYDQVWCVVIDQMLTYNDPSGGCSATWNVFIVARRNGEWQASPTYLVGGWHDIASLRKITGCQDLKNGVVEATTCY